MVTAGGPRAVIVTGGLGAIGFAVATAFARERAYILLADRASDDGHVASLKDAGAADAVAVHCDVADESSVEAVSAACRDRFGAIDAIVNVGGYHPVIICGNDTHLKATLDTRGVGTVLGWTDEMPALMGACDAMVENAGGLTANEAFAVGLPVGWATWRVPNKVT